MVFGSDACSSICGSGSAGCCSRRRQRTRATAARHHDAAPRRRFDDARSGRRHAGATGSLAGWPPPAPGAARPTAGGARQRRVGRDAGTKVAEFAAAFAAVGASYGVSVVNGTVALFLALRALGVGRDDEVIVPAYTFVASATSVVLAGRRPVIADVTPDTCTSIRSRSAAHRPRTKAIMPVHLAGAPADVEALSVRRPVVEDAAQAHGAAATAGRWAASGDAACFSFQSSKAMTAGEGGLIVTDDAEVYRRLWAVHNVGRSLEGGWYEHPEVGWNLRMTEFQAALLIPQLAPLDEGVATRARSVGIPPRARLDTVPTRPARPGTLITWRCCDMTPARSAAAASPSSSRRWRPRGSRWTPAIAR